MDGELCLSSFNSVMGLYCAFDDCTAPDYLDCNLPELPGRYDQCCQSIERLLIETITVMDTLRWSIAYMYMIDWSVLFYVLISLYLCFFVDDAPSSMSPVYWPLSVVLCLFFVLILALVRFRTQFNLISITLLPCPLIFCTFCVSQSV